MHLQFKLLLGLAVAVLGTSQTASATAQIPDSWFLDATSFNAPGTPYPIAKPDFLRSSNFYKCSADRWPIDADANGAAFYGVWTLLAYDSKHNIAFARGWTDQCSLAIFKAPPPVAKVADTDLSQLQTVRGLRIGSPYSQVLALYGGPVKHGHRFVTSYSTQVPAVAVNKKPVKLDERITLVIVDGYVSSISVYIAFMALF